MNKQLADDLRAAKALIDTPEKWVKGVDFTRTRRCAMAAIIDALGQPMGGYRFSECDRALCKALTIRKRRGSYPHPVVAFNDDLDTSHADILALFDRAIAAAEAE